MSFHILYVCTANVCRSVLAERLTRRSLGQRAGPPAAAFPVASAGTEAVAGQPMHPYVRDILRARRADPENFLSQRLTPALVATADLVLAATGTERDRAIAMVPAALGRSFTIREFARLAGHAGLPGRPAPPTVPHQTVPSAGSGPPGWPVSPTDGSGRAATTSEEPAERARAAVAAVQRVRGRAPYVEPVRDDLPDPRARKSLFRRCADQVELSLAVVLDVLYPEPVRTEPAAGPVP